jgi:hypothetical protein
VADDGAPREPDRLSLTADRIRIDAATAEVIRAFDGEAVESILLKGPALSGWLYPHDEPRSYMDSDLWIRPADAGAAEGVLTRLGFRKHVDERGLPDWWLEHGSDWTREADGVVVDLHRTLAGLGVDPEPAWRVLAPDAETMIVAAHPVRILALPARAMYITLHAAHHGSGSYKALIHLERALATVDDSTWRESASLAKELEAIDAFVTGLRLVPDGAAIADRLGLAATERVEVALRARTPPPIALGFEQLARAQGPLAGVRIVARKLVPPPGFIRHWWPPAARSRRMLLLGYMYRPLWLVRHAPRGLRAWRAARRQVGKPPQ